MKDVFNAICVVGITICLIGWMNLPFILSNISKSLKELVEIEREKLTRNKTQRGIDYED